MSMGRGRVACNYWKERLEKGDEFKCYGMPNLAWKADPGAVALEDVVNMLRIESMPRSGAVVRFPPILRVI